MAGVYEIARRHLQAAVAEAEQQGVERDRLGKAMLSAVLELYKDHRSVEDIRSEVAFELEHLAGDEDIPFMRP